MACRLACFVIPRRRGVACRKLILETLTMQVPATAFKTLHEYQCPMLYSEERWHDNAVCRLLLLGHVSL